MELKVLALPVMHPDCYRQRREVTSIDQVLSQPHYIAHLI